MATPFQLPQQYQNVNGATVTGFDPTQANGFLTNFNNASTLYSTNAANDQAQANNLIQAYQYLSDPNNQATEDKENGQGWSQYMLGQLQKDITEQTNLANYYGGNATPQAVGQFQTQLGNVGNVQNIQIPSQNELTTLINAYRLNPNVVIDNNGTTVGTYLNNIVNAISNSNSDVARSAANSAAGTTANGFQLGATEGNIGEHLQGKSGSGGVDTNALANWITAYVQSAQQGYQQLQQLNNTSNQQQNAILQGFTINAPNDQGNLNTLQNYYGVDINGNPVSNDNTGQVQLNQGQANQDIYAQAYQQRQNLNKEANSVGANSSGERQLGLGNIASQAAKNASNVYQQDANAALTAINSYNQQQQQAEQQRQAQIQSVQSGNLANLFDTSTQNNINSYNQNTQANNQQSLTNNENAINTAKQNSSLWNNIGSAVGNGLGSLGRNRCNKNLGGVMARVYKPLGNKVIVDIFPAEEGTKSGIIVERSLPQLSGKIVAVGKAVTDVEVGDIIVFEPGAPVYINKLVNEWAWMEEGQIAYIVIDEPDDVKKEE